MSTWNKCGDFHEQRIMLPSGYFARMNRIVVFLIYPNNVPIRELKLIGNRNGTIKITITATTAAHYAQILPQFLTLGILEPTDYQHERCIIELIFDAETVARFRAFLNLAIDVCDIVGEFAHDVRYCIDMVYANAMEIENPSFTMR